MTIHWSLLEEQPSEGAKRRWRDLCHDANSIGDKCCGYAGGDGDPCRFCQVCDRCFGFDDVWGDAE